MATVQQAAVTMLMRWLSFCLPGVFIDDRFPEPDYTLPPLAVTVLMAGKPTDDYCAIEPSAMTPITGSRGLYTWNVRARTQSLQLDVWTHSDELRDDLSRKLEEALNRGPLYTLNDPFGTPITDGIVLRLDPDDGYEGFASFMFDGPEPDHSGDAARVREYRAIVSGSVEITLTIKAESPRLARVILQAALDGATTKYTGDLATGKVTGISP